MPGYWLRRGIGSRALWPVEILYGAMVWLRRYAYQHGWLTRVGLEVPVLVVGNLTVGGTGKTPLVLWLVDRLREQGFRPGIVSRGYGSKQGRQPISVTPDSAAAQVGDEPLLLARRSACPVMIHPDRVRAARALLATHSVNVIVSDDGLQHYRLARDLEIAVLDGQRRYGNGRLLPAGPLREPLSRLRSIDFMVCNGAHPGPGEAAMTLQGDNAVSIVDPLRVRPLGRFGLGARVHAVAGIGNPARFFAHLRGAELVPIEHPFPDHHAFSADDFAFPDALPIIMTEKDAVKCRGLCGPNAWYVPVQARLDSEFTLGILRAVREMGAAYS
jgi:tetraacyldisaccharide 4'-kinase